MKHVRPENPFSTTTYIGTDYFCDREAETTILVSNHQNSMSTTLLSIRRIGKTGLIHHTLNQLPENVHGVYVDILDTENSKQFLDKLASSILNSMEEKSSWATKFNEFIKALRPIISFDALTGLPQASFDIKPKEAEVNIRAVFNFLEAQNFKTVVAIDEFQQILNYPEKNTDAWMRAQIQQLKNVTFIFSGSQQHLMIELFSSPSRPFFRSTQMLKLEKINSAVYNQFIKKQFNSYGKEIETEIIDEILEWTNLHTFYVQQLCNRVFAATRQKATSEIWKEQAFILLKEQELIFFTYRNMLTNAQWQLLKAIAHEGCVFQPTAKAFLEKYKLGTSATVLRSLQTLKKYQLVNTEFDAQGIQFYSVYDLFFQRWVEAKN